MNPEMGTYITKIAKSVSNKYNQKLLDSAKKSTADAIKTASKSAIQKTAEATGDLTGNKTADKITSVSKKSSRELQNKEIQIPKQDIYLQKIDHKLFMN